MQAKDKTNKTNKTFITWFKNTQKNSTPAAIQKTLQNITMKDLKKWAETIDPKKITKYSLENAATQTSKYIVSIKQKQLKQRELNANPQVYQQKENNIRKKYKNRGCFLNGYPAILLADTFNNPIIISNQNCLGTGEDMVRYKNWHWIQKVYPYYGGGTKLYTMEDSISDIQNRIKKEQNRTKHPKQEYILFHLNHRLNILHQKQNGNTKSLKQQAIESHLPDPVYHREILQGMAHIKRGDKTLFRQQLLLKPTIRLTPVMEEMLKTLNDIEEEAD